MGFIRRRAQTYLRWYSPPFDDVLLTHDAWIDPLTVENDGLTRSNFPIARACVDIWTSLEAAKTPTIRAEPERLQPPPPSFDQDEELKMRMFYDAMKHVESMRADGRSAYLRRYLRLDGFPLKHFLAVRRKNLYGFSWVKVLPNLHEKRPMSHVLRNPTNVFPIWSSRDPDDVEMILTAHQESARLANAKYGLGLQMREGRVVMGQDSGNYRDINDRYYDQTRTMVWVEEFWWIDRQFDRSGRETSSSVSCVKRVAGRVVFKQTYEGWRYVPFVYYQNSDERDSYGWSDIASVIDINDEFNRRLSQQGDIIGQYSAPRFQLLNAMPGIDVEMPDPFELIPLQDQARIEQILTRIDVFPSQTHFSILTDLLHRVTGLPPIVWGLIANAQTSGRALTASWKATEARLAPKLMANEQSLRRWQAIMLNYATHYDWKNAARLFEDSDGDPFIDFRWEHPPMEPRDFQEVTMNEITKRDAGLTTTIKAMRNTGDEAAEDTLEEVMAEFADIFLHPDKRQAFLLAQRAEIDNASALMQLKQMGGQQPGNLAQASQQQQAALGAGPPAGPPGGLPPEAMPPAGPAAVPGVPPEGGLPPAQPGTEQPVEAGGGDTTLTSGTLFRNGEVSNQLLETRRY